MSSRELNLILVPLAVMRADVAGMVGLCDALDGAWVTLREPLNGPDLGPDGEGGRHYREPVREFAAIARLEPEWGDDHTLHGLHVRIGDSSGDLLILPRDADLIESIVFAGGRP